MGLDVLGGIVVGAVSGAVLGYASFLKRTDKKEGLEYGKLGTTVVLSAIAGAMLSYSGKVVSDYTLGVSIAGLTSFGIDQLVQNVFKAFKRRK